MAKEKTIRMNGELRAMALGVAQSDYYKLFKKQLKANEELVKLAAKG